MWSSSSSGCPRSSQWYHHNVCRNILWRQADTWTCNWAIQYREAHFIPGWPQWESRWEYKCQHLWIYGTMWHLNTPMQPKSASQSILEQCIFYLPLYEPCRGALVLTEVESLWPSSIWPDGSLGVMDAACLKKRCIFWEYSWNAEDFFDQRFGFQQFNGHLFRCVLKWYLVGLLI